MQGTVILIRTYYVDPEIVDLCQRLKASTGCSVALVLDRFRHHPGAPADVDCIPMTREVLEEFGLYMTGDASWRCGDYAYYTARRAYPAAEFLWMVEPDVRFNFDDAGDFFRLYAQRPDVDLFATQLGPADDTYAWTAMMAPFAERPQRCMFPVTRLSARAVDHLLIKRQELSGRFVSEPGPDGGQHSPANWPNDEVFVATEVFQAGMVSADLNSLGRSVYDHSTFSYQFPFSEQRFRLRPRDNKIYHPVLQSDAFLRKVRGMFEHVRNSGGPGRFIHDLFDRPELIDDIRLELGALQAEAFLQEVRLAVRALS
jgi:hypothetical protein